MKQSPLRSLARVGSIASLFLLSGVAVFALQVATGWTNPSSNPPTAPGALYFNSNNVGVYTSNPTSTLSVNGEINAMGHKVIEVDSPTNPRDAVNLGYLQTYLSGQGAGGSASSTGGGSLVLYYRTISGSPPSVPTCPTGWNQTPVYTGYGPHYIALFAHDWFQGGSGGTGGGFGGAQPSIPNGGGNGYSYVLRSVAIGSDSVCSQDSQSVVNFSNIYNNVLTSGFTSMKANACFTDPITGVTECNRCIVCER